MADVEKEKRAEAPPANTPTGEAVAATAGAPPTKRRPSRQSAYAWLILGLLLIVSALNLASRAPLLPEDATGDWTRAEMYTSLLESTGFLDPFALDRVNLTPVTFETDGFHPGPVNDAAFSPDGKRIVTVGEDNTARVWDAETGTMLLVLEGHGGPVWSATFSPDGARIVTGSDDRTARIWDAATGESQRVLEGHGGPVWSADFSPDSARIITGSDDRTARIWDAATGESQRVLEGHGDWVRSAAFSPDGARIITGSDDRTARIWDAATGESQRVLVAHRGSVRSAAFSPDGARIVTGSTDRTARIWDAATGESQRVLEGHGGSVYSAAFSPDGARIVTGSDDGTARIWDAATGESQRVLEGHGGPILSAAFSPDGARIVTGSLDNTARIWDAATGESQRVLEGHGGWVRSAAFSPDGARIVTESDDGTARIWDAATGESQRVLEGHGGGVLSAAFSPDGTRIVTGSEDRTARIWDAATGESQRVLEGHGGWVTSTAFSPDGARIVTGSFDNTARISDAATGASQRVLEGHGGWVTSTAFSPDGARIVTGSFDNTARIWDAATGESQRVLEGHGGWVRSAAFSPDGARIVTGSDDRTARIWDAATGESQRVLEGHGGWVQSAAFSPDGARIVTGSNDGTIRVWDAATGKGLAQYQQVSPIIDASPSPSGDRIVFGDRTGRLRVLSVIEVPGAGPPIWVIGFVLLGAGFVLFGLRLYWRVGEDEAPEGLEAVFAADVPVSRPEFAGARLSGLADKISGFLANRDTGAPFTIAITGDWGKGKSSAMSLIRRTLDEKGYPTLWFNAWHHQKEEHLFAALMEEVRREAMPPIWHWDFWRLRSLEARGRLLLIRIAAQPLRFALMGFLVLSLTTLLWHLAGHGDLQHLRANKELAALGTFGGLLVVLARLYTALKPFQASAAALLREAGQAASLRSFKDKLSFRDRFATSFREVTHALGQRRLTIFIDDLDRCDVDQVVDIMEAINFLTSNGDCYVILGIHEAPVRHALGLNKRAMARAHAIAKAEVAGGEPAPEDDPQALQRDRDDYAELYMEKLLNLRVKVPDFDGEALANFMERKVQNRTVDLDRGFRGWRRRHRRQMALGFNVAALVGALCLAWMVGTLPQVQKPIRDYLVENFPACDAACQAEKNKKAPEPVTTLEDIQIPGAVTGRPAEAPTERRREEEEKRLQEEALVVPEAPSPALDQAPEEPSATDRLTNALVANPLYLLLLILIVPGWWAARRLWEKQQAKARAADIAAGRTDTEAFRKEVNDCLRIFLNEQKVPRVLTRFYNLARFMVSGLKPEEEQKIRGYVRIAAMLEITGGSHALQGLSLQQLGFWRFLSVQADAIAEAMRAAEAEAKEKDHPQLDKLFTEAPPITQKILDDFKEEAATIKFAGERAATDTGTVATS